MIAVVEDLERVPPMLRAAERLASVTGGEARVWLAASDQDELDWMDGQARLALGLATPSNLQGFVIDGSDGDGGASTLAEMLKNENASFVIARFEGVSRPSSPIPPIRRASSSARCSSCADLPGRPGGQ